MVAAQRDPDAEQNGLPRARRQLTFLLNAARRTPADNAGRAAAWQAWAFTGWTLTVCGVYAWMMLQAIR